MEPDDDPVRAMHNAAAHADSDVVASTRPDGTTKADLDRMVADVLVKLDLQSTDHVIELGCGTGVLALPIAGRVERFVGVDFAEDALAVLAERFERAGVAGSTDLVEADLLAPDVDAFEAGAFDRVLLYATFHYVSTEEQAKSLLGLAASLLRPGGVALIGNLPLQEVSERTAPLRSGGVVARAGAAAKWLVGGDGVSFHPLRWRAEVLARQARSTARRSGPTGGPEVEGASFLPLSVASFERWLADLDIPTTHTWVAPAPGVPMYLTRGDLLIRRSEPGGPRQRSGTAEAVVAPIEPKGDVVRVAGMRFVVPEGYRARLLSVDDDRAAVERFLEASPDATLRHQPAWMAFVAGANGRGDLVVVERDGAPQFGLPVMPLGRWTLDVGNSGILFPSGSKESVQKRAIQSLRAVLNANPRFGIRGLQSLQAPGYSDPARTDLLASLIEGEGLAAAAQWGRVLDLAPIDAAGDEVEREAALFRGYESKLRSQIRQARKHGVTADVRVVDDPDVADAAYREFTAVHEQSWSRTGLRPHGLRYWKAMSEAVTRAGGHDVVVVARSAEGEPLAVVSCHVFGERAVYLAGSSVPAGLEVRANPLCLHHAILECWSLGVTTFELGRFDPREPDEKEIAITRYKSQFGGRIVRLTTFGTTTSFPERAAQTVHRAKRKARMVRGGDSFFP